jgi:hypothetical protein
MTLSKNANLSILTSSRNAEKARPIAPAKAEELGAEPDEQPHVIHFAEWEQGEHLEGAWHRAATDRLSGKVSWRLELM